MRLRSFRRSTSGSAALEFAMLAPLFLSVALSSFEAGWLMIQSSRLDQAVSKIVRLVRVGDANAPKTQDQMRIAICTEAVVIRDCANVLTVELTPVATASDIPASAVQCVDRGAKLQPSVAYKEGSRAAIMYLRVCVVVDPVTPFLGLGLALPKDATGGYALISRTAFMNEPG
ncbi:TadE/TadG family type IV pilus assembly protein [Methylobacterium sp. ID0610]|uniref:TadE/TadG family type IV pilus assembly protein n=1 Tax=Methylobacterium carpenticola TaxID=3344827 RepID=UPI00368D1090